MNVGTEDDLYEMSNLHPGDTGLRYVIWVSGDPEGRHRRPRGKARVGDKFYPFSLDEPVQWLAAVPEIPAQDFARIAEFVRLNRELLLAYWSGEMATREFLSRLQKLP